MRTQKCIIHLCMLNIHEAMTLFVLNFGGQLVHLDMATWFWTSSLGRPGFDPRTPLHSGPQQIQDDLLSNGNKQPSLDAYQMKAFILANLGQEDNFANLQICKIFHNKNMTSSTMRAMSLGRQQSLSELGHPTSRREPPERDGKRRASILRSLQNINKQGKNSKNLSKSRC